MTPRTRSFPAGLLVAALCCAGVITHSASAQQSASQKSGVRPTNRLRLGLTRDTPDLRSPVHGTMRLRVLGTLTAGQAALVRNRSLEFTTVLTRLPDDFAWDTTKVRDGHYTLDLVLLDLETQAETLVQTVAFDTRNGGRQQMPVYAPAAAAPPALLSDTLHATLIAGGENAGENGELLAGFLQTLRGLKALLEEQGFTVTLFGPDNYSRGRMAASAARSQVLIYCGHGNPTTGGITACRPDGQHDRLDPRIIPHRLPLPRNALVIYLSACGSAGTSAGDTDVPKELARRRVLNASRPYVRMGASAYLASVDAAGVLRRWLAGETIGDAVDASRRGGRLTPEEETLGPYQMQLNAYRTKEGGTLWSNAFVGKRDMRLRDAFGIVLPQPVPAQVRASVAPFRAPATALFAAEDRLALGLPDGGVAWCDREGNEGTAVRLRGASGPTVQVLLVGDLLWWRNRSGVFACDMRTRQVRRYEPLAGLPGWNDVPWRLGVFQKQVAVLSEKGIAHINAASGGSRLLITSVRWDDAEARDGRIERQADGWRLVQPATGDWVALRVEPAARAVAIAGERLWYAVDGGIRPLPRSSAVAAALPVSDPPR